jgi:LmbE family N-acetylglucosaminyl deacetylase
MATVLVVAAHPDDEVLGCGGTIVKHVEGGDSVHVAVLGEGVLSRRGAQREELAQAQDACRKANEILGVHGLTLHDYPDNRLDSVDRLDVIRLVEEQLERLSPEIVYTHHWSDVNVDHYRINECVLAACRPVPGHSVKRLLFFEVPSSTEWRGPQDCFNPNWFVDITGSFDRKVEALEAYGRELREFPHPRSLEAIGHLARWRGATAGVAAAEAFVLGRNIC